MQCKNCGQIICHKGMEDKIVSLPGQIRETYLIYKEIVGTIDEKEILMDSNNFFGDYLYKIVKCAKCGKSMGRRIQTIDENFSFLQGLCLLLKESIKSM